MPTFDELVRKRRQFLCECGCMQLATDRHHGLLPNLKRFPMLDCEENIVLVNHWEHDTRRFDNAEWRQKFWDIQCERYGRKHMIDWWNSLPAKLNDRKRQSGIDTGTKQTYNNSQGSEQ